MKQILFILFLLSSTACFSKTFDMKICQINLPIGFESSLKREGNEFSIYAFSKNNDSSEVNTTIIIGIYNYGIKKPIITSKDIDKFTSDYLNDSIFSFESQYGKTLHLPKKTILVSGSFALESSISGSINGLEYSGKIIVKVWNDYVVTFSIIDAKNNFKSINELSKSVSDVSFNKQQLVVKESTKAIWEILMDMVY